MKGRDNALYALSHLRCFMEEHQCQIMYIDANCAAHQNYFTSLGGQSALASVFGPEEGYLQPAPAALRPMFGHHEKMVADHGNCTGFLVSRRVLLRASIWEHGQWSSTPADRPAFKTRDMGWHPASFVRLTSLTISSGTRVRSEAVKKSFAEAVTSSLTTGCPRRGCLLRTPSENPSQNLFFCKTQQRTPFTEPF